MNAPNTLTFDLTPPRRPSLDDTGGALLEDDARNPPDPRRMPYAAQQCQLQRQAAAVGNLVPVAILGITYTAGVPAITAFMAAGTTVLVTDFTAGDTGDGVCTISWAAGLLPTAIAPTLAFLHTDGDYTIVTIPGTNSVIVKTRLAGTLTDANFSVHIY